ncbi:hypothetical protein [Bacillus cereus]|uniref:hypothetical protein n=1 Tax=Bacillus cereus TaxID=1396 RepID=UPI00027ABBFE|nr:hypothetical protein [Bacillus cereus]EJS72918.1 hypothetical protein ICY_04129 [Bacillus cereus BAG2X1-3]
MTLIAGIILPNGILMVSDSREQLENTEEVHSEYRRKITLVTPTNILGVSGFDSTFYASQILRKTLFNKDEKFTPEERRACILDLYKHVNLLHLVERDIPEPVGHILLGELDHKQGKYSLLANHGVDRFEKFTVYNKVKDMVLIGAYSELRDAVKKQIQDMLDNLNEETLNLPYIYEHISIECRKIFKEHSAQYNGINDKLYCVYLSTIEGQPSSAFYFFESDGSDHRIDEKQDGETINYTK